MWAFPCLWEGGQALADGTNPGDTRFPKDRVACVSLKLCPLLSFEGLGCLNEAIPLLDGFIVHQQCLDGVAQVPAGHRELGGAGQVRESGASVGAGRAERWGMWTPAELSVSSGRRPHCHLTAT